MTGMLLFLHVGDPAGDVVRGAASFWQSRSELWFVLTMAAIYLTMVGPLRTYLSPGARFPRRRAVLFLTGLAILYASLVSYYLDTVGEKYRFSCHMLQHTIIIFVVPVFLLWGTPGWIVRPFLNLLGMPALLRFLTRPTVAFVIFNMVFSFWHVKGMFEWALRWRAAHAMEHVMFLGSALLMWWPVLSPLPEYPRLGDGNQIIYFFLLSISQIPIFALLSFTGVAYYPTYREPVPLSSGLPSWLVALGPAEDQQLGGIVMKVVGEIAFMTGVALAFVRMAAAERVPRKILPSPN